MIVYQCEDSLESIFTAVYYAWAENRNPIKTRLMLAEKLLLFAEYIPVCANEKKAIEVIRKLKMHFGEEDYLKICYALSAPEEEKAQFVYQTIAYGLQRKCAAGHLFDGLANNYVNQAYLLAKKARKEKYKIRNLLKFQELENGILYSQIRPKNNLLTFLMPYFAERYSKEDFMIYDGYRNIFGLHPAEKTWYLVLGEEIKQYEEWSLSEKEQEYQELFRWLCHKTAIKEQKKLLLQRNIMPLRFQEYMIDFNRNHQKYRTTI